LIFAELRHADHRVVPCHSHEFPLYHLMLGGRYDESTQRGRICFAPFSSGFRHSDTRHDARTAAGGAHMFTLEITQPWLQEFSPIAREPETVQDSAGGKLSCLGIRLYREYREGHAATALTIDALVWELLACAANLEMRFGANPPAWWPRIIERLHCEFRRDLRISELAREAGVHPVYLARVFRRFSGQTPGEWTQRLRVRFACEKLAHSDTGIAELAAEAGFADQSHLTRTLKRYTNQTPRQFRQTFHLGCTRTQAWESTRRITPAS
jgi:AraC family transcriptional regulator